MKRTIAILLVTGLLLLCISAAAQPRETSFISRDVLKTNFGNDAPWFEKNIPLFESSDPEIQQIYYYRWKLFKAHLRDLGKHGYIVTEFLDDVGWDKDPYSSLNDATGFHIYEGRWLKDPRYIKDYIDFMYTGGGNDRHFSEAIADATYAHYIVAGNAEFATKHLDVMQHIFNLWDDHLDFSKGLYFIEPLLDATEYTISSINASGGKDGFTGGHAFRPTINAYMYANAVAISKLAAISQDTATSIEFAKTAARIRETVEESLWNPEQQHFTDRFQVNNQHVKYWDFIRGRELAGYVPWTYNLPDNDAKYVAAWKHLLSTSGFQGPYGLRTNEPSFEYYMKQYRYDAKTNRPECQWNGPSWPFQTTQVLVGMANLLNNYSQNIVTRADYFRILKQYTHQHYLNGTPNLQEDYDPDTGQVIVGLTRSHHYNHSGYNDLIISGLVGLRPRADNTVEVNSLISDKPGDPNFLRYFCLENVSYHGHLITIVYDNDGKRYGKGAGLSIYVDGRLATAQAPLGKIKVTLPTIPLPAPRRPAAQNLAVNIYRHGSPTPSASVNNSPELLFKSVDGRTYYFPEVPNGWTSAASQSATDWFALEFDHATKFNSAQLSFYADGKTFAPPRAITIQFWNGRDWIEVLNPQQSPPSPIANGENTISFTPVTTTKVRLIIARSTERAAANLVEFKLF